LEFGKHKVDTTSTRPPQRVTVTNEGSTPLNVSKISASGDFDPQNDCNRVKPGANCTIEVTFTPTAEGARNGTLKITYNAPESPQEVRLSGTGTSTPSCPAGQDFVEGQCVPRDDTPPAINITTPDDGADYVIGQQVYADYVCQDEQGGSGVASCYGPVLDGRLIDTNTFGDKSFKVTATDNADNSDSRIYRYSVGCPAGQEYEYDQIEGIGNCVPIDDTTPNNTTPNNTTPTTCPSGYEESTTGECVPKEVD
jgi:hypothetical protein